LQLRGEVFSGVSGGILSCWFRVIGSLLAGWFGAELASEAFDEAFAEEGVEGLLNDRAVIALVWEELSVKDEAVDMLFG
jgi:hypothetical protein